MDALGVNVIRLFLAAMLPLWLIPAAAFSASGSMDSASSLMEEVTRPDEEAFIATIQFERHTLSPGTIIYQDYKQKDKYWIPLGSFMSALELQVEVDPYSGTASGWIYEEDRRFEMDLTAETLVIDGDDIDISREFVERHFDDIYVRMDHLEEWLPLYIDFDIRRIALNITTIEPLPLEIRLAAEERRSRIRGPRQTFDGPMTGPPASLLTLPFVDTNSSFRVRGSRNDRRLTGRQTLQATGGILGQDFSASVNTAGTNRSGLRKPTVRMTLGRQSFENDLLGIPGARSYAVGDVATTRVPLIANNRAGRGARLSTFGPTERSRGNRVTLRGELPTGWEVEVFRDGEILAFQTEPDQDGRYEFNDLRTRSGLNIFTLVFFGPQGQRREETERFFVDGGRTQPGKTNFEVTVNQQGANLLDLDDRISTSASDDTIRGVAFVEHGISERLTASASASSLVAPARDSNGHVSTEDGSRQLLLGGGLRVDFGGFLADFDTAFDAGGGTAAGLSLQTSIDHMRLTLEHREFRGLDSEISNAGSARGAILRESELDINAAPQLAFLGRSTLTGRVGRFEKQSGITEYRLLGRYSGRYRGFRHSLQTDWDFDAGSGTDQAEPGPSNGEIISRLSTGMGPISLRGQARYEIQPDASFRSINLTADWNANRHFGWRAGVTHAPSSNVTTLTGGINWDQGNFAVGFNTDVGTDRTFSGLLTLRIGFGVNPRNNKLYARSRGMSRSGAVAPRAFLDMGATGRFDPGDVLLEGVEFSGRGPFGREVTDENGVGFMPGVAAYTEQVLEIRMRSLADPFLAATNPKQGFFVRPGQTTYLDFPVVPTGEIDGTVTIITADRERPGNGVRLELVNKDGDVVRDVLGTFDGYYYMGGVPYGTYALRPARNPDLSIPVELNAENDFAWDTNFTVERE